jgi:hypothetical protein
MSTLEQVLAGVKTRLETISGLRVFADIPAVPVPPMAIVTPGRDPFVTFKVAQATTLAEYSLWIDLFVQFGTERTAQGEIFDYLDLTGSRSVFAAIETDDTLGGVVEWISVDEASRPNIADYGGIAMANVRFDLTVSVHG